ncbi:hypothetical protein [Streptomyces sp. NPDC047981]|uniref:hypothetical protein n=1 Tax=Streptomyces sp. NPDC047981 TaxID=3154610 RepID=UPI00344A79C6
MASTNPRNLRLAAGAALVVATVCGATTAIRLDAYNVPFSLAVACGLGAASTAFALLMRLVGRLGTTVYACPVDGCNFRARLTAASPADHRRLREAAAAHPAHHVPRS